MGVKQEARCGRAVTCDRMWPSLQMTAIVRNGVFPTSDVGLGAGRLWGLCLHGNNGVGTPRGLKRGP